MSSPFRERLESGSRQLILCFGLTSAGIALLLDFRTPFLPLVAGLAVAGIVGSGMAALSADDRIALGGLVLAAAAIAIVPISIDIGLQIAQGIWPDFIGEPDFAAGLLLHGQDPYGHDYIDSASFRSVFLFDHPIEFGFNHFPYAPGMFLLAVPEQILPWPAARSLAVLSPIAVSLMTLAAYRLGTTRLQSRAFAAAVILNPLLATLYGNLFNDVFAFAPGLLAVACAARGRFALAGLLLGLAIAIKQDAVLLAPVVATLAVRSGGPRRLASTAAFGGAGLGLVVVPFVLWNPIAFVRDTLGFFVSGGFGNSPARGPSLGGLLVVAGFTQNRWENPPLAVLQVAFSAAVLALAAADLRHHWSWARMWGWTAILSVVVFFTSVVVTSNYVGIVLLFLSLSVASAVAVVRPPRRFPVLAASLPVLLLIMAGVWANGLAQSGLPVGLKHPIAVGPAGVASVTGGPGEWRLHIDSPGQEPQVSRIPAGRFPIAVAWSSDGDQAAVSMTSTVEVYSRRTGSWREFPFGYVTAIGADGGNWVAGLWGQGLVHSEDGGEHWRRASLPPGDVEFEAVAKSGRRWLMATELGVLASEDGGASWVPAGAPLDRVTSLAASDTEVRAAAWNGSTAISSDGGRNWRRAASLPAGVWAIADDGRLVAGATGVFRDGHRVAAFGRHEAVAAGSSGGLACVALATGDVYCSDGGDFSRLMLSRG